MQETPYDFEAGAILLLDKPLTWTSFDVVKKTKFALRIKKIGHAGTLDPLATGLLIMCTGKFTKRIEEIQAQEKEYTGTFVLGHTTPSFDLETEIDSTAPIDYLTPEAIQEAADSFLGEIDQTPPIYSAVKVNGERAYTLARRGDTAEIKSKRITIKQFELTAIEGNQVHFKVVCSKGTYIRSLARDLGEKLGCGAYLSKLVRTRIGEYRLEDAMSLDQLQELRKKQQAHYDRHPGA
ncbi:tRNA pseudouridine(55) synthase TruB [Rufibacter glacialis]|uniref:tRNA pseudouridine synthase B n=1 Tax=Rufibacter glacialis TaxID=1259555 RepID=A0A5M8QJS8_9BACT|nr:tRNA pseudouridine(55) synthase TruB [Rufibacter glacialis]KAA6434582.1 tRNA pseudouridine(55) synthase TruB [Rufibacter glacialis]GGK70775.1 tRNA pseudouridine synthase B [Rufibacter glacialis]